MGEGVIMNKLHAWGHYDLGTFKSYHTGVSNMYVRYGDDKESVNSLDE